MNEQPVVNPWIVAVTVMFGTFMEVLDTTVVNVSLPHIAGNLSATTDEATWALTSYLVSNAIVLPLTGWLARRFGRKRLLMLAVTGFTLSSLLCGLAINLSMLIAFRVIQGATGGVLQPLSQSIMLEAFPPSERGKAMGFWGLGIVVAPMLGPVMGGWLTDNLSWRWVFYINVPVGIAAIMMTRAFIFDPPYLTRPKAGIDTWGIGLLAVGIATLQLMLDKGQQEDWLASKLIAFLLVVAVVCLVGFVIRELRASDPVVNLRVFKDRTYATGVGMMTLLGFVLYGSLVSLPLFLQVLLGYPAVQAGIAMLPRGLGSFIGMPLVGMIMNRFDPRKLLAIGVAGASFTLIELSRLNLNAGYWDLFWPQFFQGLSMSLLFVPLTTITMSHIAKEDIGNASSMFNFMRNIGGSMGIATATTMISRDSQKFINILGANVTPYRMEATQMLERLRANFMAHGSDAPTAMREALASVYGMVQQQAMLLSYLATFRFFGLVFLILIPCLFLMKRPARQTEPTAMH